jgi:hypothetical protein
MSESIFKVGQTVYCLIFGRGKVVRIDENCSHSYPVAVNFEMPGIDSHDFYTFDGKLRKAGRRTLYFSEPKIIADELPKFEPKLIGKHICFEVDGQIIKGKVEKETNETIAVYIAKASCGVIFKKENIGAIYIISEVRFRSEFT